MKRTIICGRKPSTAPMPLMMPSEIRPVSHGAVPAFSSRAAEPGTIHSPNRTSLTQSVPIVPMVEMEK